MPCGLYARYLVHPAYYADIICEQARFWIEGFLNLGGGCDTASSAGGAGGGAGAFCKRQPFPQDMFLYTQKLL